MKRRDFLIRSAAGAMLPLIRNANAAPPCPPPALNVQGGTSANTTCSAVDAESDWQSRISGPGVVWYHDFRSAAEVNAFRWSGGYQGGNDPNNVARPAMCNWQSGDGIGNGKCIEMFLGAGVTDQNTHWIRPYAPLTGASNGRGVDDPAAGGTLPVRTMVATNGGSQASQFTYGWYGHPSVQAADPTHFDGTEFWLQYRAKRDPRRVSGGNETFLVGKHCYIAACETGAGAINQELVVYSNGGNTSGAAAAGQNSFRMYGGYALFEALDQEAGNGNIQPGGASPIWQWNSGSWDTIMYHLKPGRTAVDETLIEVYGAHQGETSFTMFWQQTFPVWSYEIRNGWQTLQLSVYNNSHAFSQAFYERVTQIIFSKQAIPCPQV